MGGVGGSLIFKEHKYHRSVILNRRTTKTIVVGIMHYIYATFHVDLMYGSEGMNPNLSKNVKILIFQQKKSNIFVKNHDIENLKT